MEIALLDSGQSGLRLIQKGYWKLYFVQTVETIIHPAVFLNKYSHH